MTRPERRLIALLGFPALGLAFTVTVVSTYVPVLVEQVSSPFMVGLLVGGEGFFGIFVPGILGGLSDRSAGSVGGRLDLLAWCGLVLGSAAAGVGVFGLIGDGSLVGIGVTLALLYVGYYAFLAPYWALYPDLIPNRLSGRSRSAESSWRVTGVGLALISGGLLISVSPGLPFFTAAVLVAVVTVTLLVGLRGRRGKRLQKAAGDKGGGVAVMLDLLRQRPIRMLVIANGLWNFALSALRAFVVLYFTVGLGRSATFVATVIFPLVAVGIGIAAPLAGWLADRTGHVRLLTVALFVYGTLMMVPGLTSASWVIALIPVVAAGAATVMTLPFSVLMRLLPEEGHGAASGLFGFSRGVGGFLGPVVAGLAIMLLQPVMQGTDGFAAMWFTCSLALLASLPFLRTLRSDDRL